MCKLGQRQQVVSHRFEAQMLLLGNEFFVRKVLWCSETNKFLLIETCASQAYQLHIL